MSTKGTNLTTKTKNKISLAKRKYTKKALIKNALEYLQTTTDDELPTLAGLAIHLNITAITLNEYRTIYPEFNELVELLLTFQEEKLLQDSYQDKINQGFAKFLLKSKHNYSDDKQQLTQNNYLSIAPEVLKEALQLMNKKD